MFCRCALRFNVSRQQRVASYRAYKCFISYKSYELLARLALCHGHATKRALCPVASLPCLLNAVAEVGQLHPTPRTYATSPHFSIGVALGPHTRFVSDGGIAVVVAQLKVPQLRIFGHPKACSGSADIRREATHCARSKQENFDAT